METRQMSKQPESFTPHYSATPRIDALSDTPRTDAFQREQWEREIANRGKRDDTVSLFNLDSLDFARKLERELAARNYIEVAVPTNAASQVAAQCVGVRAEAEPATAAPSAMQSETEAPYNPDDYDMRGEVPILKSPTDKKDGAWRSAALRLGEQLATTGPNGYYSMTPTQWLEWFQSALPSAVAPMTASDFRLMSESEKYGCYASAMRRIVQSAIAPITFEKWLSYQPWVELVVNGEHLYTAGTVEAAWRQGVPATGRRCPACGQDDKTVCYDARCPYEMRRADRTTPKEG